MSYLRPEISGELPICTEWLVEDISSGDDDEVTCTKAAEVGKKHYITFLQASTDSTVGGTGGVIKGFLKQDSSVLITCWPQESDATPMVINFTFPIEIGENKPVHWMSDMSVNTDDRVVFTMGGFTR